jgi:hypothetical protein
MKKLMSLMLGMSLLFGTAAVVFGQDQPPQKTEKKKKGKKKKSEGETKKESR